MVGSNPTQWILGDNVPARIWSQFQGSVADRYAFGDLSKSALCGRWE